jgi:hypothetical protein
MPMTADVSSLYMSHRYQSAPLEKGESTTSNRHITTASFVSFDRCGVTVQRTMIWRFAIQKGFREIKSLCRNCLIADRSEQDFGELDRGLLLDVLGGVAQLEGVGSGVGLPVGGLDVEVAEAS